MSEQPPEEERVKSLDDRFGKIEAEQERQGGLLDKIAAKLDGGSQQPPAAEPVTRADPAPGDMAEQMRQAVRDVNAEQAQADAAKDKTPAPEQAPREVMIRGKARLQRALFGGDPK
jgi:hypothetical protein